MPTTLPWLTEIVEKLDAFLFHRHFFCFMCFFMMFFVQMLVVMFTTKTTKTFSLMSPLTLWSKTKDMLKNHEGRASQEFCASTSQLKTFGQNHGEQFSIHVMASKRKKSRLVNRAQSSTFYLLVKRVTENPKFAKISVESRRHSILLAIVTWFKKNCRDSYFSH